MKCFSDLGGHLHYNEEQTSYYGLQYGRDFTLSEKQGRMRVLSKGLSKGQQLVFFSKLVSSVNLQCKFVAAAPGAQNANFVKHKQKCTSRRFNFKNPRKLRSKFSSLKCLKHCQRHKKPGFLYISVTTSTLTPKLNSNDHLNQHKS